MVKTLFKPVFKKFRKLIFAMIIVSALAIGVYTGLSGGYRSLELSLYSFVEDYNYADIVLTVKPTAANIKSKLSEIEGVEKVNQRMAYDAPVRLANSRLVAGRFFYYQNDNFQDLFVWEESISDGEFNVGVEKKFADYNKLRAGDYLEVKANGKFIKVRIGQIVSSPECLANQIDKYSLGENSDFGMFFVSSKNNFLGPIFNKLANQFLLKTDASYNQQEILKQAENILEKRTSVLNSFTFENSAVKKRIDRNLNGVDILSILIPSFFYATMICVCSLFLVQIIRQSRRDIGILKSQGFQSSEIRKLFCAISLVIDLIGCLSGFFLGLYLNKFVCNIYLKYFTAPLALFTVDVKACIVSIFLTLAAGQISALVGTSLITRIQPSEAMARDVSGNVEIPGVISKLFEKSKPNGKLAFFTIFRNLKGFLFSAICICATITLILSTMEYDISKNVLVNDLFEKRLTYDCQIFFNEPLSEENFREISNFKNVSECELAYFYSYPVSFGENKEQAQIVAIDSNSNLINISGLKNNRLFVPEDGVILEKHLAENIGVSKGNSVKINNIDFVVSDLSDQSMGRVQYISKSSANLLGEPDRWVVHCNCTSENDLLELVKDMDGYVNSTFSRLVRQSLADAFKNHSIAVWILIFFAMFLGFLIIFNTTQTNLSDMKKEISVMRSLGFQVSDISKIWLVQTFTQFAVSLLPGLAMGTIIAKSVIEKMGTAEREYPFVNTPKLYFISIGIVVFYIFISHILAMKSIKKWNLAENVKEKE